MKKIFSIAAAILVIATSYAQSPKKIFSEINQLKASGAIPKEVPVVKFLSSEIRQRDYDLKGLKKGTIVSLSADALEELLLNRNEFIQIHLPVDNQSEMTLTLKRHEIYTRFHFEYKF